MAVSILEGGVGNIPEDDQELIFKTWKKYFSNTCTDDEIRVMAPLWEGLAKFMLAERMVSDSPSYETITFGLIARIVRADKHHGLTGQYIAREFRQYVHQYNLSHLSEDAITKVALDHFVETLVPGKKLYAKALLSTEVEIGIDFNEEKYADFVMSVQALAAANGLKVIALTKERI